MQPSNLHHFPQVLSYTSLEGRLYVLLIFLWIQLGPLKLKTIGIETTSALVL